MPRILHVEAFSSPNAKENAYGLFSAFERRASAVATLDYRLAAATVGAATMNKILIAAAAEFAPDLIFLGKCESVAGATIARIRKLLPSCAVFHLFGDGRDTPPPFVGDIGRQVDATFVQCADQAYFDRYLAAGCNRMETWIGGYNPEVIHPVEEAQIYEAVFMGSLAGATGKQAEIKIECRREMLRLLVSAGIQVDVFGGPPVVKGATYHRRVYGKDFSAACSKAKLALAYDTHFRYLYHSWPRLIRTLGSGTLLLVRRFPGLDTLFENKKHLVWFESLDELLPLARYYLAHQDEAAAIGKAGLELVRGKYTFDHKVTQVLELMR